MLLAIHGHIFVICDIKIYQGQRTRYRTGRSSPKVSAKHPFHLEPAIAQGHLQIKPRPGDLWILASQDKSTGKRVPLLQTKGTWLGVSDGRKHRHGVSWLRKNCPNSGRKEIVPIEWGYSQDIQEQPPFCYRLAARLGSTGFPRKQRFYEIWEGRCGCYLQQVIRGLERKRDHFRQFI